MLGEDGRQGQEGLVLTITEATLAAMVTHACREAPIEACGYLAEKGGIVSRVFPLTNVDASPEHYALIPTEQFAAVRQMRRDGYRLRAVYHSHPASPARMSEEDIRLAFDRGLSYVIVSLADADPVVKSFTVGTVEATADEETVVVLQAAAPAVENA
jgi:proteasome lid subunit RPN8/RPN11